MDILLAHVTPVVLCFNEEQNIERTLSKLRWASSIVLVDSCSSDATLQIASTFSNVTVYKRVFDTHANQWNYALSKAEKNWTLTLDADYVLSGDIITEIASIPYPPLFQAYAAPFKMCINGNPLRCGILPKRLILFDKRYCFYYDDGHTQRLNVAGKSSTLRSFIFHDDRKPLDRFLLSQIRYSALEAGKIHNSSENKKDVKILIRKSTALSPILIFLYVLFVKKGFLDGSRGLYYALQRLVAEATIKLRLLEKSINENES